MVGLDQMILRPVPPDSAFDAEQLARGTQVELEHTADVRAARTIAKHHLLEDRDYYRKLQTIHLDGDNMDTVPCVYCAPSINVLSGPASLDFAGFAPIEWAAVGLGGLGALVGLATSFSDYRLVSKIASGVGVAGGVAALVFAAIRASYARDVMARPADYAHVPKWGENQAAGSFTNVVAGGALLASSAVALLIAGRA